MNLSDLVISYIRTGVPVLIGIGLTYLAKRLGIADPPAELTPWVTGVFVTGYYVLARFLESRYPALGWLLGAAKAPAYDAPAAELSR